jgi:hypothetical protein
MLLYNTLAVDEQMRALFGLIANVERDVTIWDD